MNPDDVKLGLGQLGTRDAIDAGAFSPPGEILRSGAAVGAALRDRRLRTGRRRTAAGRSRTGRGAARSDRDDRRGRPDVEGVGDTVPGADAGRVHCGDRPGASDPAAVRKSGAGGHQRSTDLHRLRSERKAGLRRPGGRIQSANANGATTGAGVESAAARRQRGLQRRGGAAAQAKVWRGI